MNTFFLIVLGQIISLFGNAALRVAAQMRQGLCDLLLPLPGKGCCKHRLQLLQPGQGRVVPDMAQRLPHLGYQNTTLQDIIDATKLLCGVSGMIQ